MNIVHLTASPFLGGPELQMIGLGQYLPKDYRSTYVSFSERGLCRPFLQHAEQLGFETIELRYNAPHYWSAVGEIKQLLHDRQADVLVCHGYKSDLLGGTAARRAGVCVIAVSHGWTGHTLKVRFNERLDKWSLRWMSHVICVSQKQAEKVEQSGVKLQRIHVIHNAIDLSRFEKVNNSSRQRLQEMFPAPRRVLIGAAGRFSPEKGFDQLVSAARVVVREDPNVGFVLFGDGPLKESLVEQITAEGLEKHVVLAGFKTDLEQWLPALDVFALSSHTEGLPTVLLEAFAVGLPVVATAVGGTPEVVDDGESGYLVPPAEPRMLAKRLLELVRDQTRCTRMGQAGYERVKSEFTFPAQAQKYIHLFEEITQSA